jgi:glycine oxidase
LFCHRGREKLTKSNEQTAPVAVIGGGIIGLAVGWQLLRRGRRVTIFERDRAGRAASYVAAGMLAPHAEVGFEQEEALCLGMESLGQYPDFLRELAEDSGESVTLDERGTLIVGFNRDDTERIRRLYRFREHLELPVRWLSGSDARDIEPLLSPKVTAAIWLPDDSQVNNRSLIAALIVAFRKRGGLLKENTAVRGVLTSDGRAVGVTTDNGEHAASEVVLAAGCWSKQIDGIPAGVRPPVRPVKGQIVTLRMNDELEFGHVIRAPDVYLLPKDDGRLLVGGTQEEMGFDTTPTAGSVLGLLERGWEAVPFIYDLAIESIEVGLRPGSRDHEPIIGAAPLERLYYATGHHRSGILLAPITAYGLSELIVRGRSPDVLEPFKPSRFIREHKT